MFGTLSNAIPQYRNSMQPRLVPSSVCPSNVNLLRDSCNLDPKERSHSLGANMHLTHAKMPFRAFPVLVPLEPVGC